MNANLPFQNNFPVLIFYRFGAPFSIYTFSGACGDSCHGLAHVLCRAVWLSASSAGLIPSCRHRQTHSARQA